jgi:hypothetical protein
MTNVIVVQWISCFKNQDDSSEKLRRVLSKKWPKFRKCLLLPSSGRWDYEIMQRNIPECNHLDARRLSWKPQISFKNYCFIIWCYITFMVDQLLNESRWIIDSDGACSQETFSEVLSWADWKQENLARWLPAGRQRSVDRRRTWSQLRATVRQTNWLDVWLWRRGDSITGAYPLLAGQTRT